MIRHQDKIRLTAREQQQLSEVVQEPANPQTIEEYNTWLEHAGETLYAGNTPEERLIRAMLKERQL